MRNRKCVVVKGKGPSPPALQPTRSLTGSFFGKRFSLAVDAEHHRSANREKEEKLSPAIVAHNRICESPVSLEFSGTSFGKQVLDRPAK
jgi:hypothetical protein